MILMVFVLKNNYITLISWLYFEIKKGKNRAYMYSCLIEFKIEFKGRNYFAAIPSILVH